MRGILVHMSLNDDTGSPDATALALHACCGPCLIEPLDAFEEEGHHVTVLFYNPNIHPQEEYERRRDVLIAYATRHGVDVVELPYDPAAWHRAVASSTSREERCLACYRLRLGETARWAAAHGHAAISTTLAISPYQDGEAIGREGASAAAQSSVEYLRRDFRDRYSEATRRSRDEGMYRQNYCGCAPSQAEAQGERAQRKEARAQARKNGDAAGI